MKSFRRTKLNIMGHMNKLYFSKISDPESWGDWEIKWWEKVVLWFLPTYVMIESPVVFFYKSFRGRQYIIGHELIERSAHSQHGRGKTIDTQGCKCPS